MVVASFRMSFESFGDSNPSILDVAGCPAFRKLALPVSRSFHLLFGSGKVPAPHAIIIFDVDFVRDFVFVHIVYGILPMTAAAAFVVPSMLMTFLPLSPSILLAMVLCGMPSHRISP